MKRSFAFILTLSLLAGMLIFPVSAAESTVSGICGDGVTWEISGNTVTISGTGPMYDYTEQDPAPWMAYNITTAVIQPGVTRIGAYSFITLGTYSLKLTIPATVTEIAPRAVCERKVSIFFDGSAMVLADNAFENCLATFYYVAGWEESELLAYGAQRFSWIQGQLTYGINAKKLYNVNDPIGNGDFMLRVTYNGNNERAYIPQNVQLSAHDNSTCGEKSVSVVADGYKFTHRYFVTDGNVHLDAISIDADVIHTYTSKPIEPEPVIKLGDITLTKGLHYNVSWQNNTTVTNYARIVITGLGEFSDFSRAIPFAILRRNLTATYKRTNNAKLTGNPLTPSSSINDSTLAYSGGSDYLPYYENNTNLGTGTCYIAGYNNCYGFLSTDFQIQAYNSTVELKGTRNGRAPDSIDNDDYHYAEYTLAPAQTTFWIYSTVESTVCDHYAFYELYRVENGRNILVASKETEYGHYSETEFIYDFSQDYNREDNAVYVLSYSWVDHYRDVYSGICKITVTAKVPDATAMVIGMVDNASTYRNTYLGVHGIGGNLGKITWVSSDPSVASVEHGQVTMKKPGSVTITAQYESLTDSIDLQVVPEELSQARIFTYDSTTGKASVIYDGFLLEEGVDYTLSVTTENNLTKVTATGMGLFQGSVTQAFDAVDQPFPAFPTTSPEEPVTPPALPIDTDAYFYGQAIIYTPVNNMALSARHASFSHYRNISVPLESCTMEDVWTLNKSWDGYCQLSGVDGKFLNGRASPMSIISGSGKWQLCPLDNGTYALKVSDSGRYLCWSDELGSFTTGTGDPREDANYQLKFYMIPRQNSDNLLKTPEPQVFGQTIRWEPVEFADVYEIYRSTSKNGKYTNIGIAIDTTYTDNSAVGKTYYYKVQAIDTVLDHLNSKLSNAVCIVYKCAAPEISVENAASGKPCITWSKVSGAKKYTVYRATSENGKYSKLGTTTKLSYTDSKAKAGTTYFYKVIANASKSSYNSGYSNIVSCGVICGTPSIIVKIDSNTGKPSLSWKKVDGAAGYAIFRDSEPLTTVTGVSFKDETAAIDTQYSYAVQALGKTEDLNGSLSKAVSATSGIAKPAAKGSVDTVSGKPVLSWEAVEGAVKYELYRSTKSSKSYKLVATVESLSYTDETVSAGKTYYYKVKAIGAVSKSADSSYVKLTGKCATPEITITINASSGKPVISWEKISGAKKYTVYRATSETGKYKKLGTTTKLSYTDSKAAVGTAYYYKIVANASSSKNNSPYSNIAAGVGICAKPVVKITTVAASGKPQLTWKKVTSAVKYVIYVSTPDGFQELATVTGTKFVDEAAQPGERRRYVMEAVPANETCRSLWSEETSIQATCAAPKPSGKVGENKKPVISWGEVEGAVKYVVYRSTSKSKGYKAIGESETLTYEDLTAKKGKTYYYKVVAVGNGIQSAQSSYVKIKSK